MHHLSIYWKTNYIKIPDAIHIHMLCANFAKTCHITWIPNGQKLIVTSEMFNISFKWINLCDKKGQIGSFERNIHTCMTCYLKLRLWNCSLHPWNSLSVFAAYISPVKTSVILRSLSESYKIFRLFVSNFDFSF